MPKLNLPSITINRGRGAKPTAPPPTNTFLYDGDNRGVTIQSDREGGDLPDNVVKVVEARERRSQRGNVGKLVLALALSPILAGSIAIPVLVSKSIDNSSAPIKDDHIEFEAKPTEVTINIDYLVEPQQDGTTKFIPTDGPVDPSTQLIQGGIQATPDDIKKLQDAIDTGDASVQINGGLPNGYLIQFSRAYYQMEDGKLQWVGGDRNPKAAAAN